MKQLQVSLAIFFLFALAYSWVEVKSLLATQSDEQIKALAFSLDDNFLYSAGSNGKIQVWSMEDYTLVTEIQVGQPVNNIIVHQKTGQLYVSTTGGKLYSYDNVNYQQTNEGTFGGKEYAYDIAFVNSGNQIQAVGENTEVPTVYSYNTNLVQTGESQIAAMTSGATLQQIETSPNRTQSVFVSSSTSENSTYVVELKNNGDFRASYDTAETYDDTDVKLLALDQSNPIKLFVGEQGTETVEIFDIDSPTAEEEIISLTDSQKIYALNGDIKDRILLGTSNGDSHKVLIYDYKGNSVEYDLGHDSQPLKIKAANNDQIIAVGQTTGGLKIWRFISDQVAASTEYTVTLSVVAGVVLASSVGALAATSVAQGAAGATGAIVGAAGGGDTAAATMKNLL